ncbi:30S ribosomal protein S17 [Candidatus Bathyarchaeota archaeon]|nr:30S ribosomal protein S17 [Candidatus Bathyarchaeota archaeon]NIU80675.1 30S ribosomal protein S17 [Candidatus Bathyarchaeota archaeon]NIV67296.1 30S ribosomal protein S17 [Candidatus Bathyarchaeota archaeon]NIW15857.1 30S ribosomal protein S17 [Candidatus Bathyarchaeota archaeon]NIW33968.1 30S ribosomal protein S17 [Candidatus Bathyarchaeota archaeon]
MVEVAFSFEKPRKSCEDPNCPFHGSLSTRGRVMDGVVVSAKMDKTVVVRRDYLKYWPKYKRYERRHSHVPAHNPPCIGAREGNRVKIAECRPISKTVSFVVVEKVGEG